VFKSVKGQAMQTNLVERFLEHCEQMPLQRAVTYIHKHKAIHLNWDQVKSRVDQIFSVLKSFKVSQGDRVVIMANTCKEWGFVDMACFALGAITVPIYHSSSSDDIELILNEVEPTLIFVDNDIALSKILNTSTGPRFPILGFQPLQSEHNQVFTLNQYIGKTDLNDKVVPIAISEEDVATIIYTSGTSGRPKGVTLTHRQVLSSVGDVFPLLEVSHEDVTLTFLPYSHILGRLELWGHYYCGYRIGYAQSIETLKRDMPIIKPTVIVGVPRVFEKIYFGVLAQIEISKLKKMIFSRAIDIGRKLDSIHQSKKSPGLWDSLRAQMAHRLVFDSIHSKLGGRLRFAVSGGAPLDPEIHHFFRACGLPILEGYGLTETTGPVFVNTLFENKAGFVGKAVGDVELRFAEDGEILVRSHKVMTGYFNQTQSSEQAFDDDGFFRTGDIGELDADGFLKITDRKKDLIKTAGGKFVAPQKLQNLFSTSPLISHVHIHGDRRKYIVALLTLDPQVSQSLAAEQSSLTQSISQNSYIQQEVRKVVAQVNSQLASHETIKRFHILEDDFSVESGELTPSLKMRRKIIDEKFKTTIDNLYQ
jgi:long-chain acyl-CoA synthetase